jgi:phosphoribosylformylglycinamidine cyclo-ligase
VGTKLKLAIEWQMHAGVGIDLVAMSVNDILVQGAEPLYFLDYFACGKLDIDTASTVIEGIAKGCELSACALIGGETAEMPDMYPPGEYDLAGFAVGVVEKSKILTGQNIAPSDVVLGLASSGVHSNGFSLVRKLLSHLKNEGQSLPTELDGMAFKTALMAPTRIYVKTVLEVLKHHPIKALAHITGGGLIENLPRVLPAQVGIELNRAAWPKTQLFDWIQKSAQLDEVEMNRTFNNGIGMALVIDAAHAQGCKAALESLGEQVYEIGRVVPHTPSGPQVRVL